MYKRNTRVCQTMIMIIVSIPNIPQMHNLLFLPIIEFDICLNELITYDFTIEFPESRPSERGYQWKRKKCGLCIFRQQGRPVMWLGLLRNSFRRWAARYGYWIWVNTQGRRHGNFTADGRIQRQQLSFYRLSGLCVSCSSAGHGMYCRLKNKGFTLLGAAKMLAVHSLIRKGP